MYHLNTCASKLPPSASSHFSISKRTNFQCNLPELSFANLVFHFAPFSEAAGVGDDKVDEWIYATWHLVASVKQPRVDSHPHVLRDTAAFQDFHHCQYFYRTQVSLGFDLWVRFSQTH